MFMTQTLRWFGPTDPVSLRDIRQSGATEVVTALHDVPNGDIWTHEAIAARKALIAEAGLGWTVVESLPIHEGFKTRSADWQSLVDKYRASLRNLAANGITTVTYNFMPLLDWTRTDLAFEMPDGALALRFEWTMIAVYDIHMLKRPGAEADYTPDVVVAAAARFAGMSDTQRLDLERTIIAGLPGSEESFTSVEFLEAIGAYAEIDSDRLRENHIAFLEAICPVAEEVGIRMVVHPDDPPFPIFGIARVVSTAADLEILFDRVPSKANGVCFCCGSFGARLDNDLPAMIERFAERIGFLHLRSVQHTGYRAFHEAAHLEGDAPMAEIVTQVHAICTCQNRSVPIRPDHGHQMLDDLSKKTNPGYSLLGRMRGLAELRGLERGIAHTRATLGAET